MTQDSSGEHPGTTLDPVSFVWRASAELARVRRRGGFLSLVLLAHRGADPAPLQLAEALKDRVRLDDVLGRLGDGVAILMPHTTANEAAAAASRLLHAVQPLEGRSQGGVAAGVAAVFGDVEGGAQALVDAAREALASAAPGEIARSHSLQGRPWILVVDDDPQFASLLAEAISERGWEGHPCSHPEDAVQRLADNQYRAMFVDLVMPRMNGVAVLKRAMAADPKRPAVLMSGFDAGQAEVLEALELGPVMFIRKPISSGDLTAALEMFRSLLPGLPPSRTWR